MSNARFSIIPGWVVADRRLKGRDLQVLCVLGQHTNRKHGWCRRSQVKMAAEMGCARSTVQASLDRLVKIGAVERREVISDSGRDSAHWYRVIYDRVTPEEAFREWDRDDELSDEEFGAVSDDFDGETPADIPAPPADIPAGGAGPESAPPAGPGSAPINDSSLTPSAERRERGRERDDGEGENPQSIERGFKRWFPTWPTHVDDSLDEARRAWYALTAAERREALELTPTYLRVREELGRTKKGTVAAGKYLREKRWQRLGPTATAGSQPPTVHKPFSRAWQGLAISRFFEPEAQLPPMTPFMQRTVAAGGPMADRLRREHRERWAWPKATDMYAAAEQWRGQIVPAEIVGASEAFKSHHINSAEVAAWRRLYERMGWPWPPTGKAEWICFPTLEGDGGLDQLVADAVERYREQISDYLADRSKGDDHAA